MSTADTFQSDLLIPLVTCCSKLIESLRRMACVVGLSHRNRFGYLPHSHMTYSPKRFRFAKMAQCNVLLEL